MTKQTEHRKRTQMGRRPAKRATLPPRKGGRRNRELGRIRIGRRNVFLLSNWEFRIPNRSLEILGKEAIGFTVPLRLSVSRPLVPVSVAVSAVSGCVSMSLCLVSLFGSPWLSRPCLVHTHTLSPGLILRAAFLDAGTSASRESLTDLEKGKGKSTLDFV